MKNKFRSIPVGGQNCLRVGELESLAALRVLVKTQIFRQLGNSGFNIAPAPKDTAMSASLIIYYYPILLVFINSILTRQTILSVLRQKLFNKTQDYIQYQTRL